MNGSGSALAVRADVPAVQQSGALAIDAGQTAWTTMQVAAFGQLGIADAPEGDKQVLLHVSQRTGLDPFARQLYMIGRKEKKNVKQPSGRWEEVWSVKWTIQTGIEGFRVIRHRAEREEGVRGILGRPVYYNGKGERFDVWFFQAVPVAVEMTYTVRDRNGVETPYVSILRFDEYRQTRKETRDGNEVQVLTGQWATKPTHMLEKCTEADLYRKAFPQDYSGVELDDAMPLPDPDDAPDAQPERPRVTAADARARAPQRVTAVVVDASPSPAAPDTPSSGPPGSPVHETAAAGEAPDPGPAPDDPAYKRAMNAAQAQLKRFVTGDTDEQVAEGKRILAARILKVEEVRSMTDLTVDELRTVSNTCGSATGPDAAAQLEALLTAAEVPGE